ncbi:uncharacterized protein LOC143224903 isoform X2 [Tachypleus tridentatus]
MKSLFFLIICVAIVYFLINTLSVMLLVEFASQLSSGVIHSELIGQKIRNIFTLNKSSKTRLSPWYINVRIWKNYINPPGPLTFIQQQHDGWLDTWEAVTNTVSIYSAYWDSRPRESSATPVIRIIGRLSTQYWRDNTERMISDLKCVLRYADMLSTRFSTTWTHGVKPIFLKMEKYQWHEVSVEFVCNPKNNQHVPREVTIIRNNDSLSKALWIRVHNMDDVKRTEYSPNEIAVCIKPLTELHNSTFQVAEFLAYYLSVGAKRFTFYDLGITYKVRELLYQLSHNGVAIDILPWYPLLLNILEGLKTSFHLPRRHGTWVASIQDCILRHSYRYGLVVVVDVDQFIVPQVPEISSLQELVTQLQNPAGYEAFQYGEYRFLHAHFCLNYPSFYGKFPQLHTLTKVERRQVSEGYWGSKYIARPELVDRVAGFSTTSQLGKAMIRYVKRTEALLHHYRNSSPLYKCGDYRQGKEAGLVVYDATLPSHFGKP